MADKNWFKQKWPYLLLLVLALFLPWLVKSRYIMQVIIVCGVWSVATLSLNLLVGYTGLVSLAHAGFFGIGAYGVTLMTKAGMSFWLALPISAIIAVVLGLAIGMLTLRTRESYFAISTLCFGVIVYIVSGSWIKLTGGHTGIVGISRPNPIFGISFTSQASMYYLVLGLLLLALFVMHRLVYSLQGLSFMAIRNNEVLAESVGINTFANKLLSFLIANFFAALAGGVYATIMGSLSPSTASFNLTFNWIVFLMLGGVATLAGPIVGAFAITFLMEYLYFMGEYQLIIFGALLIAVIIYCPRGLMGIYDSLNKKVKDFREQRKGGAVNAGYVAQSGRPD